MDEMDVIMGAIVFLFLLTTYVCGFAIHDPIQHDTDFDLGSVVSTTSEYEYLTNDSFTGVVVREEGWRDTALTVRNRDGTERRIATEFLEPME